MKNNQLINDLKNLLNSLENKEEADEIKNSSNRYIHIFETIVLKAGHKPSKTPCVEITSSYEAFQPNGLQIIVKNIETQEDSFVEICNISVMGTPQLINYDGIIHDCNRGTSLIFKEQQNWIDFSAFGSSPGQGLVFNLNNPHSFDIEILIVLTGSKTSSNYIGE